MCVLPDIAHCPLYIASHDGDGLGCVDDLARPCKVSRGEMDWQTALLRLAATDRDYPLVLQLIDTRGAA
ncbi:MAG: hypothetical protein J0H71_05430 [Rhizobiales bacterium]|nr:hypothetical protein [Hyphomicrobiales bacterium]